MGWISNEYPVDVPHALVLVAVGKIHDALALPPPINPLSIISVSIRSCEHSVSVALENSGTGHYLTRLPSLSLFLSYLICAPVTIIGVSIGIFHQAYLIKI